jgi:hypothetical protein
VVENKPVYSRPLLGKPGGIAGALVRTDAADMLKRRLKQAGLPAHYSPFVSRDQHHEFSGKRRQHLKPLSGLPATPTARPQNSMMAAVRRYCWRISKGFDISFESCREIQMPRDQVFISCSHEDKKWCDEFEEHLRSGSIVNWSDRQIAPGSEWFKDTRSALANSKVAVLFVSPVFLASDFIYEHEIAPLPKEEEKGSAKILWRPVRVTAYRETSLEKYQVGTDPGKALAGTAKANRGQAWVKIYERIKAVNASKERFFEGSSKDAAHQSGPAIVAQPVGQKSELPSGQVTEQLSSNSRESQARPVRPSFGNALSATAEYNRSKVTSTT